MIIITQQVIDEAAHIYGIEFDELAAQEEDTFYQPQINVCYNSNRGGFFYKENEEGDSNVDQVGYYDGQEFHLLEHAEDKFQIES